MDSIVLISDRNIDLESICREITFSYSDGSLYYTDKEGNYLNIHNYSNAESEYESDEINYINSIIEQPKFFYLDTNYFILIQKFAQALGNDIVVLFDNDRGKFFLKEEIIKLTDESQLFESLSI